MKSMVPPAGITAVPVVGLTDPSPDVFTNVYVSVAAVPWVFCTVHVVVDAIAAVLPQVPLVFEMPVAAIVITFLLIATDPFPFSSLLEADTETNSPSSSPGTSDKVPEMISSSAVDLIMMIGDMDKIKMNESNRDISRFAICFIITVSHFLWLFQQTCGRAKARPHVVLLLPVRRLPDRRQHL